MITRAVIRTGGGGGSGTAVPKTIVGVHGSLVGDQTDPLEPDATTGKLLSYIKLTRTALGDGDLMGDSAGGVAISVVGDVVSVTDGTNTTHIPVQGFSAIDDDIILLVKLDADGTMICGRYEG